MNQAENSEGVLEDTLSCERVLKRNHLLFNSALGVFVVLCSFTYGLVVGFGKQAVPAHASLDIVPTWDGVSENLSVGGVALPKGLLTSSLGNNASVNGSNTEVISFVSARPVQAVLAEQVENWERAGYKAFGAGNRKKGVALATDPATERRFIITAWRVPPTIRKKVTKGMPVQGMVSSSNGEVRADVEFGENEGHIPGIPLIPGGVAGAVFSSVERSGGRSFTGTYKNPGTVADSIAFYRSVFSEDGWREISAANYSESMSQGGHLTFRKKGQEVVFLFSPVGTLGGDRPEGQEKTLALINRGPGTNEIPF